MLGPTEVVAGGRPVELGGRLPRRLLTALVAADGRTVTDDNLAELVWGRDRPLQAISALRAYTSRLRRALGGPGQVALRRQGLGYALPLESYATDVARFTREVTRGRELVAHGRFDAAERVLAEALSLWRGDPYADLGDAEELGAARSGLVCLRETAVEELLGARLAAGGHLGVVSELEAAVRRDPYRERLWELLVVGLYRAGRQADALAALRGVRTHLAEGLGIDPGPGLRELEQRVLAQDPGLLAAPHTSARVGPHSGPDGGPYSGPDAGPAGIGWPLTACFGRTGDLDAVGAAMAGHRLVTLVGPAGVGKTRLAIEYLATRVGAEGLWLARLADVSQPVMLAQALAEAVGAVDLAGDDPHQRLVHALKARPGLLVLDNCEHLVEPVAALAQWLLEWCPGLRILATSREALRVDGEALLTVDPLPTRAGESGGDSDDSAGSEAPAVALLFDRVRVARPGWMPTAADRVHAEQVCTALDGLPLAIELAAARTRVMSLGEIAQRLDDRFGLLGGVPRGTLSRHATLRAAIAWSVDQLGAPERALCDRLWAFEGGFCLEAADAVRPTDAPVIDSIDTLVTRSVVTADTTVLPTRYRMLETLRAYCREHDTDAASSRKAHARWVRELVERRTAEFTTTGAGAAMRQLSRELSNLRAAIDHDLAHDPATALRVAGRLNWFWHRRGHVGEGRRLLESALRAAPDAEPLDRGHARLALITVGPVPDTLEGVRRAYRDVLECSTAADDDEHRQLYGLTQLHIGFNLLRARAAEAAREAGQQTIATGRQLGQEWLIAGGDMVRGAALVLEGRSEQGQRALGEAAALAGRCGYRWVAGCAHLIRGWDTVNGTVNGTVNATASTVDPHTRGELALAQLKESFHAFQIDADRILSPVVLSTAALALARTGRHTDAAALQLGVAAHLKTLGVPALYLQRVGALIGDFPPLPELTDQFSGGTPPLNWTEMTELLGWDVPPAGESRICLGGIEGLV
ncbi:MAG TPA: BTAD domain-containing putative transcriptional regulator [Pseudonocardia sp.]|nr:BTAD domain-containing putative transcriptional regulator [Pseudonocardia sp.]